MTEAEWAKKNYLWVSFLEGIEAYKFYTPPNPPYKKGTDRYKMWMEGWRYKEGLIIWSNK